MCSLQCVQVYSDNECIKKLNFAHIKLYMWHTHTLHISQTPTTSNLPKQHKTAIIITIIMWRILVWWLFEGFFLNYFGWPSTVFDTVIHHISSVMGLRPSQVPRRIPSCRAWYEVDHVATRLVKDFVDLRGRSGLGIIDVGTLSGSCLRAMWCSPHSHPNSSKIIMVIWPLSLKSILIFKWSKWDHCSM